ncbi:MAG TPA: glycosyltransferase family 39 protein [Terriglobia bacterium]|nr:glycosyltransferase family 39 protein [Terriglobia bacterium]
MKRSRLWLVLALLFVFVRALPNLSYPIFRDQATYCVISQGLLHGGKLYRDLWDIKPPGIFWIYEPIVKLFGPVMWSVGLVDILWLLALSWCIFRFAERTLGTGAAVIAVAANTEFHCRTGYEVAAQADAFLVLFVLAAYLALGRAKQEHRWALGRAFLAGVLLAAAFWLKYNALVFLPLLVLVPYLDLDALDAQPRCVRLSIPWTAWLKRTAALAGGGLAGVLAVLAYFWRAGLWTALLEAHFAVIPRYGASPLLAQGSFWLHAVARTITFLGWLTPFAPVAAFIIAWKRGELGRVAPALAGAVLGYTLVATQVQFFPHTFDNCFPFFAMAWGYLSMELIGHVAPAFRPARVSDALASEPARVSDASGFSPAPAGLKAGATFPTVLGGAAITLVLALQVRTLVTRYKDLAAWRRDANAFYAHYPAPFSEDYLDEEMSIAQMLRSEASPHDRLYVWGHDPLVYYLTGLHPPTRFVVYWPLALDWGMPGWREEFMRDLSQRPPEFIVVDRPDKYSLPAFDAFVAASYHEVAGFPHSAVYRRRR